MLGVLKDMKL